MPETNTEIHKNSELSKLNKYIILLVVFTILWSIGLLIFVKEEITESKKSAPIVMVDVNTGEVLNSAYTNLLPTVIGLENTATNSIVPLYEQKGSWV